MTENKSTTESGWTIRSVPGPVAEKTGMPQLEERLEQLRLSVIHRRENLLMNWVNQCTDEELIALLREDGTKYGFAVAHSNSLAVQQAVIKVVGMANTPETLHWLTLSEHDEISSQAQELWDAMAEEYPQLLYGFFSETLRTHT